MTTWALDPPKRNERVRSTRTGQSGLIVATNSHHWPVNWVAVDVSATAPAKILVFLLDQLERVVD
jgi:hypothetical protein